MLNSYYTGITYLIVFVLIIMMLIVSKSTLLARLQKHFFLRAYFLFVLTACCEWISVFLDSKSSGIVLLHHLAQASEYSLLPYFYLCFLKAVDLERKNKWLPILAACNVLFAFASVFSGLAFTIAEHTIWLYTVPWLFFGVYAMGKCFKIGKHFQTNNRKAMIALLLLLFTGFIMRQMNHALHLELLCITLASIFLYIYYITILQKSDPLTGLLNRSSYVNKLSDIREKAAVLYFDVDEFKEINDKCGHLYGDTILHAIGQIMKEVYADYGSCYRIGGDEFCVILEEKLANVHALNATFTQLLEQNRKTGQKLPTVSLGYSLFDPEKDAIEDVIYSADKEMYRTKTKLQKALQETNVKLLATVQAFQLAAEEASTLVFIYDLKEQSILVDERTAKAFGVAEKQHGIPYETAKMGIISQDTVAEYIRIHEEMLNGAARATGIVKLIQTDGSQSTQRLSFRAVFDENGVPTGNAVGMYSLV